MWDKKEKESAVQSFRDFINEWQEASESCAQHPEKGRKTEEKVLCFAQKNDRDQADHFGLTSWMTGSMENPCISQRNCSEDMDRRSSEDRGQEK